MPDHPPALWFGEVLALNFTGVVDAVVIGTQPGEIRWVGLTAVLVRIDVVHLAPTRWHLAVWPWGTPGFLRWLESVAFLMRTALSRD